MFFWGFALFREVDDWMDGWIRRRGKGRLTRESNADLRSEQRGISMYAEMAATCRGQGPLYVHLKIEKVNERHRNGTAPLLVFFESGQSKNTKQKTHVKIFIFYMIIRE